MTRVDFATIANWIRPHARVLDLGCGDGLLLKHLRAACQATGYGIEIDDDHLLESVRNGVNVIQIDLETGLLGFDTQSFDYVILSQTIQAVRQTESVLREMMRVGREGIITVPNFGYWKHRLDILRGNMPVSKSLPYQWFDTPNIHLCTLDDFERLCAKLNLRVMDRVVLHDGAVVGAMPNLRGSLALYRVAG